MKGYLLLIGIVWTFLLMLPPLLLGYETGGQAQHTAATSPSEDVFLVRHTDGSAQSSMNAYELVLYATAAAMPADAPAEAIKAQAVVCYTAFCYERASETGVVTTAQAFPQAFEESYWKEQWGDSFDANIAVYRAALDEVLGKRILYNGEPVMAVFHELNTGATEDGTVLWETAVAYLKAVASPADALDVSQLSTVTVEIEEAKTVFASLGVVDTAGEPTAWFGEASRTDTGTVKQMTVCGQTLSGSQIREAFSLPSAAFEVSVQGNELVFTVHGRGHFVGMSICGAQAMAQSGQTYEDIIKHYYTDVTVA